MPLSHAISMPIDAPSRMLGRPWLDARQRSTLQPMAAASTASERQDAALAAEESRLAHSAASGDGSAFATLYERYERRAYNLAYRVTGSEDDAADAVQDAFLNVMRRLPRLQDRDLAFGSYLFTATRNACYDLMQKRKRAEPSDSIPESAAPVGSGAAGVGLDPGDPGDDPSRKLLLESQQDEIRAANERLPERQREVLALRELEELSYDEIAAIMDMNRNSVAQLISRARIRLRDELRGGALASIAASSPECERALPLIAMREDGQLASDSGDASWLDGHMAGCETCRLGREAMQEAGTSYRAWVPIVAAPLLFKETMAKAAELIGADWSDTIAERALPRTDTGAPQPGMPSAYGVVEATAKGSRRRRGALAAAGLAAALLVAVVTIVQGEDDPSTPAQPATGTVAAPATTTTAKKSPKHKRKHAHEHKTTTAAETAAPATGDDAPQQTDGSGSGTGTPVETPTDQGQAETPAQGKSKTKATPPPTATPDPPPVVDDPPVVEEPPPAPDPPPRRGGGATGGSGPIG